MKIPDEIANDSTVLVASKSDVAGKSNKEINWPSLYQS